MPPQQREARDSATNEQPRCGQFAKNAPLHPGESLTPAFHNRRYPAPCRVSTTSGSKTNLDDPPWTYFDAIPAVDTEGLTAGASIALAHTPKLGINHPSTSSRSPGGERNMFELPDAKRVRREDLYDSSGSDGEDGGSRDEEADAVLRSKLNAQLAGLLDLDLSIKEVETPSRKTSTEQTRESWRKSPKSTGDDDDGGDSSRGDVVMGDDGGDDQDDEPVEFAFRLFSGEDPSHKVVLEKQQDESADAGGDGGLVVARRPDSYYIAQNPSAETLDKFRAAAVRYDLLLADAGVLRWGVEKPWKVTTITITTTKKNKDGKEALVGTIAGSEPRTTRKRPGKKRRIVLRTRDKAKKKKEVTTKQEAVDKEQHVLDKKKRLNRQKKLKRRAKAKEQKQQGGAGDDTSDDDDGDVKDV